MNKKSSLRKATALIMAMLCIFALSAVPAYAAQTNQFTLSSNSATTTVHLTQQVTAGSTTKTYQVVKYGSNCTDVKNCPSLKCLCTACFRV